MGKSSETEVIRKWVAKKLIKENWQELKKLGSLYGVKTFQKDKSSIVNDILNKLFKN